MTSLRKITAMALAAVSTTAVLSVAFAPAASAEECSGPDGLSGRVVVNEGGFRSCVGTYPSGDYFNVPLPESSTSVTVPGGRTRPERTPIQFYPPQWIGSIPIG